VRAGDRLLAVDGGPVTGMGTEAVARLLAGPPGTPVALSLVSFASNQPYSVRLVRRPAAAAPTAAAVPPPPNPAAAAAGAQWAQSPAAAGSPRHAAPPSGQQGSPRVELGGPPGGSGGHRAGRPSDRPAASAGGGAVEELFDPDTMARVPLRPNAFARSRHGRPSGDGGGSGGGGSGGGGSGGGFVR
jgi:hypothetical protein